MWACTHAPKREDHEVDRDMKMKFSGQTASCEKGLDGEVVKRMEKAFGVGTWWCINRMRIGWPMRCCGWWKQWNVVEGSKKEDEGHEQEDP